jgi:hypothetical protein
MTDCVLKLNIIFSLQVLDNALKEEEEEEIYCFCSFI